MTKQKSLRKSSSGLLLTAKMLQETINAPCFPQPGPNHLQLKFNSKMQDVKRVFVLNC